LVRQSVRLKVAASAAGLGKAAAHRPSARPTVDTPVLVSVHQVYTTGKFRHVKQLQTT
jgi:hypothetical protein